MACFGGKKKDSEAFIKAKAIDDDMKRNQKENRMAMKILLLGTGDAGKSTFARQLAHAHNKMTAATIATFVPVLRENALGGAQQVIHCAQTWKVNLPQEIATSVEAISAAPQLSPTIATHIETFFANPQIKKLVDRRGDEMQIQGGVEGVKYYFENCKRFAADDFVPTFDDILKARRKTSGVLETVFEHDGTTFTLVDVGGQRSERKKWLHCFSTVTAVIFLAAINEYDMVLEEDANTNRLVESLKLWKALTSSEFFTKTPFILFLNKSDLFRQKLETVPLSEIFQDWEEYIKGPSVASLPPFEQGWRFLAKQYENHFAASSFYAHVTCAIDPESCKKVWTSVHAEMVKKALAEVKLL
jgi:GTPase SAR1 family protein